MFRLTYNDNGTAHDDLVFQFGETSSRSDSYYFVLDHSDVEQPSSVISDGPTGPPRVRTALGQLFSAWNNAIEELSEYCYLLVELQDQATKWVQCELVGDDDLRLSCGWSSIEGWSVRPSADGSRTTAPDEFDIIEPVGDLRVSRNELCNYIEQCQRMLNAQVQPTLDPTPLFEHYRGAYGTQLLTAAVAHFNLFDLIHNGVSDATELSDQLGLQPRPMTVLTTALKAMGLLEEFGGQYSLTPLAEQHLTASPFQVSDYIGLSASSPDVLSMVERLKTNRPSGLDEDDAGAAFIYREGVPSAMEESELARHFTMSLAGRAKNVAPVLADRYRLDDAGLLLDVGGGSGIYAIAYLARNPHLRAICFDRPEVLSVAAEFAEEYGVADRLELLPGDMFTDELPQADVVLLSNILHDWDIAECQQLVNRCANALNSQGRLLIHDVFLNDTLDGPLPIALYSAALFTLTEGRAYSVKEYSDWLNAAGLKVKGPTPTLVHCGVLVGQKGT